MEILFFLISCLLLISSHQLLSSSAEAAQKLEYPYPFMTFDAEKAAARPYDYIVVGGGTAGCPLAATLSQHYSVLLIERGDSPYGNPDTMSIDAFFKVTGDPSEFPYAAEGFVSEDGVQLARGRVLGGGTAINAAFYSRASSEYIREMGWDEKLVNESYEWVEKLNVFKPKISTWTSAFKDALLEAGLAPYNGHTLDHLEGTKIGGSIVDSNGRRHTSADLLQYANPDNIVVLLNATASRILFDSSSGTLKAIGVEFMSSVDEISYQVFTNQLSQWSEVILAAGSLGSPQLLMLSGIGPSKKLEELNITTLLKFDNVGKGIKDPPRTTITIQSPKPLEFCPPQVVGIIDNSQVYIESVSYYQQENATNDQHLGLIITKVAFPLSSGELNLRSKSPKDSPIVRYNYFSHPYDQQKCFLTIKALSKLTMTNSMQEFTFKNNINSNILRFVGFELPKDQSDIDGMVNYCRDTVTTFWHYHGGCQIDSVIDKRLHVYGVDSLRVVDNSIFTRSPGTNPQATIMMLARYTGVKILQERMNICQYSFSNVNK